MIYTDDLFKEYLEYVDFYGRNYQTLDELDSKMKYRREMLFEMLPFITKQLYMSVGDFIRLYDDMDKYIFNDHAFFRMVVFEIMKFLLEKECYIDVFIFKNNFLEFSKL